LSLVERTGDWTGTPQDKDSPAMMKKVVIAVLAGTIALSATACNTVRGAGNDLESAANAVDKKT
jgi:entericidin B